jgi:hypothetical protein
MINCPQNSLAKVGRYNNIIMAKSQDFCMIHQTCTIGAGLLIMFGLYYALFGNERIVSWLSAALEQIG